MQRSKLKLKIVALIDRWLDENPTSPIETSEITEADIVTPKHYKSFLVFAQLADEFVKNVEGKCRKQKLLCQSPEKATSFSLCRHFKV